MRALQAASPLWSLLAASLLACQPAEDSSQELDCEQGKTLSCFLESAGVDTEISQVLSEDVLDADEKCAELITLSESTGSYVGWECTEPEGEPVSTWIDLDASGWATCGVSSGGELDCWGCDEESDKCSPPSGRDYSHVDVDWYGCALLENGALRCWGCDEDNNFGECDSRSGPYTDVASTLWTTCAIDEQGSIQCWGSKGWEWNEETVPEGEFVQLDMADHAYCGVTTGGDLECWGDQDQVQPDPDDSFTQIASSSPKTCAVTTEGEIRCWGSFFLGDADPPAGNFTQVEVASGHGCALTTEGTVSCWGCVSDEYDRGQCRAPTGYTDVVDIAVGTWHSCLLRASGEAHCWGCSGEENYGQCDVP